MAVTVDGKRTKRRVVYQYLSRRAKLDLSNIEKTIAKAQKIEVFLGGKGLTVLFY